MTTLNNTHYTAWECATTVLIGFADSMPLWLALVYAAYAIGRRQITLTSLFAFVTIESVALGYLAWRIAKAYNWVNDGPFTP